MSILIMKYETEEEAERIISEMSEQGFKLVRVSNITEGNFLGFIKNEEPINPEEEIEQLKLAMAEMAEAHEQEKTEMQLALAELAELVGGEPSHG